MSRLPLPVRPNNDKVCMEDDHDRVSMSMEDCTPRGHGAQRVPRAKGDIGPEVFCADQSRVRTDSEATDRESTKSTTTGDAYFSGTSSELTRPSVDSSGCQGEHPMMTHPDLLQNIKLVHARDFRRLHCPLPRSQDLPPSHFGLPTSSDIVFSISHAWRNQTHPDPKGSKHKRICDLLAQEKLEEERVLIFLDWLGIPQRPFRPGQAQRTAEESEHFSAALRHMHNMYFHADRIIHLENEEDVIEGEGVEYSLTSVELQGAHVGQTGEWVQIVADDRSREDAACAFARTASIRGRGRRTSGMHTTSSAAAKTWSLFDRILAVDDVSVTSAAHFQALLSEHGVGIRHVRLCRYPYGRVNSIPADNRGWVYLERFITMVKCAMLDEEAADKVVVTNSAGIRAQILAGAARLREAARRDDMVRRQGRGKAYGASSHLEEALQGFLRELGTKKFSAASTDKLELDAEAAAAKGCDEEAAAARPSGDREVVGGIMTEFVSHLISHWQVEAKGQRHREKRLGGALQAAQAYFLNWERFSDKYMQELSAVSHRDPLPILGVVILPPALTSVWTLMPYPAPDQGWREQALWIYFGQSYSSALCLSMFPLLLATVAGVHRTWDVQLKLLAWVLWSALSSMLFRAMLIWALDLFPLPMMGPITAGFCTALLPVLWFCIPEQQRALRSFRKRAFCALLSVISVMIIFGLVFPLMNVALTQLALGFQAVAILAYLLVRLGFEKLGYIMATHVGADVMPCFTFTGAFFFEVNLCIALSKGIHTIVFGELIAWDCMENLYCVWSVIRQDGKRRNEADPDAPYVQYYIVSTLILREFVQMVVPLQFLVQLVAMREIRPEYNDIVCEMTDEWFKHTALIVGLNMLAQLVLIGGTTAFLRRYGLSPLRMLQGQLSTHRSAFLATAICATGYYFTFQHAHCGNDLTFNFLWVRDRDARWHCGLDWSRPLV